MPAGSEVVVMLNGTAAVTVMLSGALAFAGGEFESVTCTVKFDVPPPLGVPMIAPVFVFNDKPPASCRR